MPPLAHDRAPPPSPSIRRKRKSTFSIARQAQTVTKVGAAFGSMKQIFQSALSSAAGNVIATGILTAIVHVLQNARDSAALCYPPPCWRSL